MPIDINLTPLYRIQGQESADMPGLLVMQPPKNAARGREQDRLIVYLALTGNATITLSEYRQFAENTANIFYQTPRAITSALRSAAEALNKTLLERNMKTSGLGQYTLGWLALAVVRDAVCTYSLSGPMHAYAFTGEGTRHIFEPAISGKGLGSSQTLTIHYAQAELANQGTLLFCGRVPNAWAAALEDANPTSFEAMRRRLTSITSEDLNAVLFQTREGSGAINLFKPGQSIEKVEAPKPEPEPETQPNNETELTSQKEDLPEPSASFDEDQNTTAPLSQTVDLSATLEPEPTLEPSAHFPQPATYPTPPASPQTQPTSHAGMATLPQKTQPREFPASIPRAKPNTPSIVAPETIATEDPEREQEQIKAEEAPAATATEIPPASPTAIPATEVPAPPREPSPQAKQAAKTLVNFMHGFRTGSANLGERLRKFLPHLLPAENAEPAPVSASTFMGFLAVLIPLIVVTLSVVVYLRYGRNEQYDAYYNQALQMRQQALALSNPVEQRMAWENVLENVAKAEEHRQTSETITLKNEAQAYRDQLLGITRMQFSPAFSTRLGIEVSRMAASEKDIYLLNAANGEVLRAIPSGNGGFELDTTFSCKPGVNNSAGPLVDILSLPITNIYGASVLGIDATGNLLYCKPGSPPQTGLLTAPDTNWGRITAIALDAGNLYVLDAPARAVWVYGGKETAFLDRPYFFFGEQTPTQDVIDFVIAGDEMHLLHADGRISNCTFSRLNTNLSRCEDPLTRLNPFPAYGDTDLFGQAHFTQILFAAPPDPSILLLDADHQSVMRFAPRSIELQNQFLPSTGSANPIPSGPVGAVAVSPDHVLYIAVSGQIYFALNMP